MDALREIWMTWKATDGLCVQRVCLTRLFVCWYGVFSVCCCDSWCAHYDINALLLLELNRVNKDVLRTKELIIV